MKKRAGVGAERQEPMMLSQLMLPLLAGIVATKNGLLEFVHGVGMRAVDELLLQDAARLVGPKGRHQPGRTGNHWGRAPAQLTLGGRRVSVSKPRVRGGGRELALPAFEQLRAADPLPERVLQQILLGVSTRGYDRSIEAAPPRTRSYGTSKSAASRHVVARTEARMREHLAKRLDGLDLVAMFVDGIEVGGHSVIAALGVVADGAKVPLGLWVGSTENATVCTALLQDLVARGLRLDERILCVIDGGKGLRKALADVLGDRAVVQRCQVHKLRNVRDHLPETRRPYVARQMRDAYRSTTATTARRRLQQLVSWLESNGEDGAAASLREGLEETLTVLKLGLPATLCRTFSTTNAIENMNGTIRRVTRNVKRWRGGGMVKRWVALGVCEAHRKFRRVKGHRDFAILVRALRGAPKPVDSHVEAA